MKPVDFIVIAVVVLIVAAVMLYLRKAKKQGIKCIGCPDGAKCAGSCGHCSGNCCGCGHSS